MKKSNKIRIPGAYISPYSKNLMDCFLYGKPKKQMSNLIDSAIKTELEPNFEDICNQLHIKPIKLDITDAIINGLNKSDLTADDDQEFTVNGGFFEFEMKVTPYFKESIDFDAFGKELQSVACSSNKVIPYLERCEMDYNMDLILNYFL